MSLARETLEGYLESLLQQQSELQTQVDMQAGAVQLLRQLIEEIDNAGNESGDSIDSGREASDNTHEGVRDVPDTGGNEPEDRDIAERGGVT